MIVYVPITSGPRSLHPRCIPSVIEAGFTVCTILNPALNILDLWFAIMPDGFLTVEPNIEILPCGVTETQKNILNELKSCDKSLCYTLGCSKYIPKNLGERGKGMPEHPWRWHQHRIGAYEHPYRNWLEESY